MIEIGNKEVASITIGGKEVQTITIGGKTAYEKQDNTDYFYIENTYNGPNTVTLNTVKSTNIPPSGTYSTTVQYSKNKLNWTTLTLTVGVTNTITLNQGEKVYFRNDSGKWNYYDRSTSKWLSNCFSAEYSHSTGGNVNSLGDYNNMSNFTLPQGFIFKLFGIDASTGDTTLNDISDLRLTATTMTPYCYKNVFSNCSSITTIPQDFLPATNTADGCYMFIFQNTGVTEIPNNLLKATTTSNSCYQGMFEGCGSLVNVHSNLLQATTLSTGCYRSLFYGCSSLNQVTTYANDISASNCLSNWLNGVAATGDFYNLGSATYPSGASGIPTGWTEHKFRIKDTVLTPATGTEYYVTANVEWSPSLTWTSADIIISDSDSGAGTRSATLTFTPGEVVNGVLTPANNIDINFQDPDTWFELIVYNNGTVVDTQTNIPYTVQ